MAARRWSTAAPSATMLNSGGTAYFLAGSFASGTAVNNGLAVILPGRQRDHGGQRQLRLCRAGRHGVGTVLNGGDEFVEAGATDDRHGRRQRRDAGRLRRHQRHGHQLAAGSSTSIPAAPRAGPSSTMAGSTTSLSGSRSARSTTAAARISSIPGLASGTIVAAGGAEFVEFGGTAIGTLVSGAGATQDVVAGTALEHDPRRRRGAGSSRTARPPSNTTSAPAATSSSPRAAPRPGRRSAGGIVELTAGAVDVGPLAFAAGAGGLLKLDDSQHFVGNGRRASAFPDQIDLEDIAFGAEHDARLPGGRQQSQRHPDGQRRHPHRQPDAARPIRRRPVPHRQRRRRRYPRHRPAGLGERRIFCRRAQLGRSRLSLCLLPRRPNGRVALHIPGGSIGRLG